jgi:hypothetical protein
MVDPSWPEIDCTGHCIRRDTKNGIWTRPVGQPVREYLKLLAQTRTSNTWVFPNRNGAGGAGVKKKAANLFDAAGLTDARSRDLRRTFSTIADDEGYSEATIGMLIGDSPRGIVRKHYIQKPDQALIAAADRISSRIAAALDGKPVSEPDPPPSPSWSIFSGRRIALQQRSRPAAMSYLPAFVGCAAAKAVQRWKNVPGSGAAMSGGAGNVVAPGFSTKANSRRPAPGRSNHSRRARCLVTAYEGAAAWRTPSGRGTLGLAPSIRVHEFLQRAAAYRPEPTHRIPDWQQRIAVLVRR